ncbi:arylsulfotransferase ASST [Mesonia algae]|uniref:Arylsulfotransferase ASST n=1 Tax=Mesonia algae TaxID=213248 RepID=A0A2W7I2F8_9FLAO|nr:aryl-sulfate sulfotransferase [Mesonia algae]PZW39632.1 arylsulfotransferase ASST [Mesonia algae]
MKKFILLLLLINYSCSNDDEIKNSSIDDTPVNLSESISIYDEDNFLSGFTLYTPTVSNKSFLINMEGHPVKEWVSEHKGLVSYLDKNGNLYRVFDTKNSNFNSGGSMGGIEMFDFEGNLVWQWIYSDDHKILHHDIALLPNGNILASVWEKKTKNEAIEAGRDPSLLTENEMWPDKVIEIKILGNNEAEIVWEWTVWDHLIQDYDDEKSFFGNIENHPELVNINHTLGEANFNHINSIDYVEEFDQIILSSRKFNEFWVIDHSTTTIEAKGHTGGNFNKGGDLLFRYGNPYAYKSGDENNQTLFAQHDVTWLGNKQNHGGNFLVFNNAFSPTMSSVDEIKIPQNSDGSYPTANASLGSIVWSYQNADIYSPRVSGARRLENGNTLITQGTSGLIYEIDINKTLVWKYKIPLAGNQTFKAFRYPSNYNAFNNKNLEKDDSITIE